MAHRISKLKKDIKGLNAKEIPSRIRDVENHIFQLRMQLRTGQLASTAMSKLARKELARLKSALTNRA